MNRKELSRAVAEKRGMTLKQADEMVDLVLELISESLANGDKVTLSGFGTFEIRDRAAREGRNPQTGEVMHIPARRSPAFTAGKKLKESVKEL